MKKVQVIAHLKALKVAYDDYAKVENRKKLYSAVDADSLDLENEMDTVINLLEHYSDDLDVLTGIREVATAVRKVELLVGEYVFNQSIKEIDQIIDKLTTKSANEAYDKPIFNTTKVLELIDKTLKENPSISVQGAFIKVVKELGYNAVEDSNGKIGIIIGSVADIKSSRNAINRAEAEKEVQERKANQPKEQCNCIGCRISRSGLN